MTQGTDIKIKALAPWFGGKRNLAPEIIRELGAHRSYWDIFCGSMSILLSKPPATMETVNDLHGELINLAQVVRDPRHGRDLARMLRRTLMHEGIFAESDRIQRALEAGEDLGLSPVERAYHYFVASWMGRNGCSGQAQKNSGTYCIRYTHNGGHAGTRWHSTIKSIPGWRRRLKNVTILNRDSFELAERIGDQDGTAIYVDPPYIEKKGYYLHDDNIRPSTISDSEWEGAVDWAKSFGFNARASAIAWHKCLADRLSRFTHARVVVSYYEHMALQHLYSGWTKRCIEVNKAMASSCKRGSQKTKAVEVLLINGPSYAGTGGLF